MVYKYVATSNTAWVSMNFGVNTAILAMGQISRDKDVTSEISLQQEWYLSQFHC